MSSYINAGIIKKLDHVIYLFEDQGPHGFPVSELYRGYGELLAILDAFNLQAEPVNGRFLEAKDRIAVYNGLEVLHATMSQYYCPCTLDEQTVYGDLVSLREYLAPAA